MHYLLFLTSISIAIVAAWYSITGLIAIFSGAVIPIAIMGSVLEVGKLVTASWLHQNWKEINALMKTYLVLAVLILMLITSMGIFGFLSKAHLDQTIEVGGNNSLRISSIERRIDVEKRTIEDSEKILSILDGEILTLQEYDRIRGPDGALAVREGQSEERELLNQRIEEAQEEIEDLQEELMPLRVSQLEIEAEVGPIKYIAELIYGQEEVSIEGNKLLDNAVRIVILLLVSVFDPLAVVLLLAANKTLQIRKKSRMFTDNGEFIIDPNNVMIAED